MRVNAKIRKIANKGLHLIGKVYHKAIPMSLFEKSLSDAGLFLLDDDMTPLKGCIFCGTEGMATFRVSGDKGLVSNSMFIMTWYKMTSGHYEILSYLS